MSERELLQRLVECLDGALDDVAEVIGVRLEPCSPHYDDELADRRRLVQQSRAAIADAGSLLAQPERKPKWTDTPPTAHGHYWYRPRLGGPVDLLYVEWSNGLWFADYAEPDSNKAAPVLAWGGQWAGPLTPPEE